MTVVRLKSGKESNLQAKGKNMNQQRHSPGWRRKNSMGLFLHSLQYRIFLSTQKLWHYSVIYNVNMKRIWNNSNMWMNFAISSSNILVATLGMKWTSLSSYISLITLETMSTKSPRSIQRKKNLEGLFLIS